MSWDEWNKGYFSYGPHSSYDAQQGAWTRERDKLAEGERQRKANESSANWTVPCLPQPTPTYGPQISSPSSPGEPATFGGTVKGMAIAGGLLALAYAYFGLGSQAWPVLAVWAIKGIVAGAVAGVALYVCIVILRVALAVLAVALKVALWAGLVLEDCICCHACFEQLDPSSTLSHCFGGETARKRPIYIGFGNGRAKIVVSRLGPSCG